MSPYLQYLCNLLSHIIYAHFNFTISPITALPVISFIFSFRLWLRKTIALLYLVLIALLSLLPSYDLPHITLFPGADKLVHFCMYFGLSVLACWSLDIRHNRMGLMYWLLAGVFFWGVLMEILQRTMHNGRSFDFMDMIANLVGALLGLWVYRYLEGKRKVN